MPIVERIASRIVAVRGQRVTIDADPAALYGVPTKRLNELERKVGTHDRAIAEILGALRQLTMPPESPKRRRLGFL